MKLLRLLLHVRVLVVVLVVVVASGSQTHLLATSVEHQLIALAGGGRQRRPLAALEATCRRGRRGAQRPAAGQRHHLDDGRSVGGRHAARPGKLTGILLLLVTTANGGSGRRGGTSLQMIGRPVVTATTTTTTGGDQVTR